MRYFTLIILLSSPPVLAQALLETSTSSGPYPSCPLTSTELAFAARFRSTSAENTEPGFQCDAVSDRCVKFGPGRDTSCGVNLLGEVVCGRTGQTTGIWRYWGTVYANTFSATNITTSNVATIPFLLQTSAGHAENQNANKPWRVNDAEGFQNTCRTTLPTCGTVPEATEVVICGTGGALTKRCFCTSDGTSFWWRNTLNPSAGAGTNTTCPAT